MAPAIMFDHGMFLNPESWAGRRLFIVTRRLALEDAPAACKTFRDKEDGCIKLVLKP